MRVTTAGESHGKGLFAIMEGLPAGLKIDLARIDGELSRRQSGAGRGARQSIEHDRVELLAGVRDLTTLGSPLALAVWNADYENWKECMSPESCDVSLNRLTRVRPGHADFVGSKKFGFDDARNISERASARETAVRVAVGSICRLLLEQLGIFVTGYVRSVGSACSKEGVSFEQILSRRSETLGMVEAQTEREALLLISEAERRGDTLGGVCELRIKGLKSGFGSCMTAGERLNARLVGAIMSVQGIKGAEVGLGFSAAERFGSEVQDELFSDGERIFRKTNRAGGIEGGMSNGEEIVLRAAMKPIPTLRQGLSTVDLETGAAARTAAERGDICAVTACEVILEAVLLTELCSVVLERLGGDSMDELLERYGRLPQ